MSVDERHAKGAIPKQYIFDRPVARYSGGSKKVFTTALMAAEALILEMTVQHPGEPLDAFDVANNIGYYSDGLDMYLGCSWKWSDGEGDLIERIYSADPTVDPMMVAGAAAAALANDAAERSEPYSPPRKVRRNSLLLFPVMFSL